MPDRTDQQNNGSLTVNLCVIISIFASDIYVNGFWLFAFSGFLLGSLYVSKICCSILVVLSGNTVLQHSAPYRFTHSGQTLYILKYLMFYVENTKVTFMMNILRG